MPERCSCAQYKKQTEAVNKERIKHLSTPITVQEVLADRRMEEAYCLKYAACAGEPGLLGKNFDDCLENEEIERESARRDDIDADSRSGTRDDGH
jgi:hypothetical protein